MQKSTIVTHTVDQGNLKEKIKGSKREGKKEEIYLDGLPKFNYYIIVINLIIVIFPDHYILAEKAFHTF